jgi:hypothetical protein
MVMMPAERKTSDRWPRLRAVLAGALRRSPPQSPTPENGPREAEARREAHERAVARLLLHRHF